MIVIAGLTVGLSVYSWNAARVVGNQLPMPFGVGASVVLSPSMEPAIHENDLVFVSASDHYDVGDVVVYQDGTMLVIHRIIAIDGDTITTKGDANNASDEPVKLDSVKGKMTFRIPYIGFIFKYIKTVPGTIIVVLLAVFLMYRSRRKEKDKDNAELDDIVSEIRRLQALQQTDQTAAGEAQAPGDNAQTTSGNGEEAPAAIAEPVDSADSAVAEPADAVPAADEPAQPDSAETVDSPETKDAEAPAPAEPALQDEPAAAEQDEAQPQDDLGELSDVHAMLDDLSE